MGDSPVRIGPLLKGLLTFIPGMVRILPQKGIGGTCSAEYCYEVWLKHLTMLWESGIRAIPDTVAELGPRDSIGTGLAAMLSGANTYYALDVIRYSNTDFNLKIFEQLVELFKARAGRPTEGWPDYDEYLDENLFPSHILTEEVLKEALAEERVEMIRNALVNPDADNGPVTIRQMVPWSSHDVIQRESVDLILSQSVLEHVVDLEDTYRALYLWLKPNGMMSHQIDFTAHRLAKEWNGYRAYSETLWKMIRGKRRFLINRQPCSVHVGLMEKNGFKIVCHLKRYRSDGIPRSRLSSHWASISDDDLACSGTFIQAQKQ
jgi:hypothetical protein